MRWTKGECPEHGPILMAIKPMQSPICPVCRQHAVTTAMRHLDVAHAAKLRDVFRINWFKAGQVVMATVDPGVNLNGGTAIRYDMMMQLVGVNDEAP